MGAPYIWSKIPPPQQVWFSVLSSIRHSWSLPPPGGGWEWGFLWQNKDEKLLPFSLKTAPPLAFPTTAEGNIILSVLRPTTSVLCRIPSFFFCPTFNFSNVSCSHFQNTSSIQAPLTASIGSPSLREHFFLQGLLYTSLGTLLLPLPSHTAAQVILSKCIPDQVTLLRMF